LANVTLVARGDVESPVGVGPIVLYFRTWRGSPASITNHPGGPGPTRVFSQGSPAKQREFVGGTGGPSSDDAAGDALKGSRGALHLRPSTRWRARMQGVPEQCSVSVVRRRLLLGELPLLREPLVNDGRTAGEMAGDPSTLRGCGVPSSPDTSEPCRSPGRQSPSQPASGRESVNGR
jgi:hypothetical protein